MKNCPFCGGSITAFQGYRDLTYFSCSDPTKKKVEAGHCGAVISFRDDNAGGYRGSEAVARFDRRAGDATCA